MVYSHQPWWPGVHVFIGARDAPVEELVKSIIGQDVGHPSGNLSGFWSDRAEMKQIWFRQCLVCLIMYVLYGISKMPIKTMEEAIEVVQKKIICRGGAK